MKVVFTETAALDLSDIEAFITRQYPEVAPAFEAGLQRLIAYISRWPSIGHVVEQRPGVRSMPVGRFPYKLFFRVRDGVIEVLHIHHMARRPQ